MILFSDETSEVVKVAVAVSPAPLPAYGMEEVRAGSIRETHPIVNSGRCCEGTVTIAVGSQPKRSASHIVQPSSGRCAVTDNNNAIATAITITIICQRWQRERPRKSVGRVHRPDIPPPHTISQSQYFASPAASGGRHSAWLTPAHDTQALHTLPVHVMTPCQLSMTII